MNFNGCSELHDIATAVLLELDGNILHKGSIIRLNAMKWDWLESIAMGNQLNDMQETSWPVQCI